jgi:drug/metabolite transporter (DMT)-like permease
MGIVIVMFLATGIISVMVVAVLTKNDDLDNRGAWRVVGMTLLLSLILNIVWFKTQTIDDTRISRFLPGFTVVMLYPALLTNYLLVKRHLKPSGKELRDTVLVLACAPIAVFFLGSFVEWLARR